MEDDKAFASITGFDLVAKNMAVVTKQNGGVAWTKKPIKAPMTDGVPKKLAPEAIKVMMIMMMEVVLTFTTITTSIINNINNNNIRSPLMSTLNISLFPPHFKVFADIQLYMGDGPKGASKAGNWVTLMAVLNGASKPDLVDEIYVQLLKQTTANPNMAACCRGWEVRKDRTVHYRRFTVE
jgi:hypothetical protein